MVRILTMSLMLALGGGCRDKSRRPAPEPVTPDARSDSDAPKVPKSPDESGVPGKAKDLTLTSFNVLNFGAEDHGETLNAERDERLAKFIQANLKDTDVFILQEVVDKERFKSRILPYRDCASYDSWEGHQYVMVCVGGGARFVRQKTDENYAIEEISYDGRYRPAVHGIVEGPDGRALLYVVGVHLKANADKSDVRENQIRLLAAALQKASGLPVVIAGDFNTTPEEVARMTALFDEAKLDLVHLEQKNPTYNDGGSYKALFDHFWVSQDLEVVEGPRVYPVCEKPFESIPKIADYNQFVSDHCPLTIKVRIPSP